MRDICLRSCLFVAVLIVGRIVNCRIYIRSEERGRDPRKYIQIPDDEGNLYMVNLHPVATRKKLNVSNISVLLHTRKNQKAEDGVRIHTIGFTGKIESNYFNPKQKNVFVVHGWRSGPEGNFSIFARDGILAHEDANIFLVDYSNFSRKTYTRVRFGIPAIYPKIADFVNALMANYRIPGSQVMLAGFSMGAQIVGGVGSRMKERPAVIVGLDPAGPLFYVNEPEDCLDPTDGTYVHVIHTNGGRLGLFSALGHADYYPNGGKKQPGCGFNPTGMCSHSRAYQYWKESMATGNFCAVEMCGGTSSYMGGYPINTK